MTADLFKTHKSDDQEIPKSIIGPKKKFLLIVLPYFVGKVDSLGAKTRSFLSFPYGPLTIASYVRKKINNGSEVNILDLNLTEAYDSVDLVEIIAAELRNNYDLVGFSFMFDTSYPYLVSLSHGIKKQFPTMPVILGGAAATTGYTEILGSIKSIDAVCYSEGERAILELLEDENFPNFNKAPWVTNHNLTRKPNASYVESLDDVVDLDYSLVEVQKYSMKESFSPFATYRYLNETVNQFFLVTSRGCPFKCTFCAEPALHGGDMRYSSVDRIISHVAELKEKYNINVLTLYDDQLLIDVPRAKELFKRLAQFELRVEMPNGVTAVFIDDELAGLMKSAGVDTIPLALESGSEHVLDNIIIKPLRLNKLPKIIESLRKVDIFIIGYFVIGMPGEEDIHRAETYDLIKTIDLDWSSFSIAALVRGSNLYDQAKAEGWLPDNYGVGSFKGNHSVLNVPGVDSKDIEKQTFYLNLRCNFVENRALKNKDFQTAARLFKEVAERTENQAFAYYFLGQAQYSMGDLLESNHSFAQYQRIIDSEDRWKEASIFFNLKQTPLGISDYKYENHF